MEARAGGPHRLRPSSRDQFCGRLGAGRLRSGTDTIVPWLVSDDAVATRVSDMAARRMPSYQPVATTQSLLSTITSAGASMRSASFTLWTKPTFSG